ncbi:MAG: RNA-binding cell elongation regulator Jag/EloR [SAR202 cluster bacterium]|jgi:spoIIIJ-associated protein|nr:RNA-binding cell elongation regulator Jag/EloR [SAR202 cluster bacterium]
MNTIQMTGKTVEDAIEIALRELDVDRGEVEIDVISRGKAGVFGLGSEPAKVKVSKVLLSSSKEVDSSSDIIRVARETIDELISLMDVDVMCNLRQAESEEVGGPLFEIEGDDSGLLIGRKGETLRSLQFMVRFLVSRKTGERANLSVDVEGYDDRRRQSLSSLANRVAQRVVKTGRSIELEPMNPRERRLVHITLSENGDVYTESSGTGEGRRVVILPR